jgi:uncharacterized protein (DUF1778 family)
MKKPVPKPKKTAVLAIRMTPETKASVENAAAQEEQSLSQWVVAAIKAALKSKRRG